MGHKVMYFERNASSNQGAAGRYSYVCENDVGTEGYSDAVKMSDCWPWLEEFVCGLSS